MALNETIKNLNNLIHRISQDLAKTEHGNKAAAQRVRTGTIRLEKIAKHFRKESVQADKTGVLKKMKEIFFIDYFLAPYPDLSNRDCIAEVLRGYRLQKPKSNS